MVRNCRGKTEKHNYLRRRVKTYDISKSGEDTQPVYDTAFGTKINTQLITDSGTVNLIDIPARASEINVWLETTGADGRMTYAKKVRTELVFTEADLRP